MNKIAFFCIPAHGHINPTLEVIKELIQNDCEVRYYCYDIMREKIESSGATFISCDKYDDWQNLAPADAIRIITDISFSTKTLVDLTLSMDKALLNEMSTWKPDCIVADSMALWGKLIALKLNIPFVSSTTTFAFNQHSSKIMRQSIGELMKVLLQMGKAKRYIRKLQIAGYPVKNVLDIIQNDNDTNTIVYTSPEFQPCSETFSDKYSFVGPSIRNSENAKSLFIKQTNRKIIYISLGTVNNDKKTFYDNCIEAFQNSNFDVIISIGNSIQVDAFNNLPDNIKLYNYVDQIQILQQADAFITHCGMNSVNEALYYQVPLIMFPQTKEQQGVAYRVNELKAGIYLEQDSVENLRSSVIEILENPLYKENAIQIAESFHRCGGSKEAAKKILMLAMKKHGKSGQ